MFLARLVVAVLVLAALPAPALAHTLSPPKNLTATVTGSGVELQWKKSSDGHVDGYDVYRRTATGDFAGVARVTAASYTDPGATGGTYRVTSYSASGSESTPSAEVAAGAGTRAGTAAPPPGPASHADVSVTSNTFTAPTVDVTPGATVTWHFDQGTHTATADAGQSESFDSGNQSAGTFAHTFTQEGRYTYVCRRHSGMDGVVIVRNAPTTSDTTAPDPPADLIATPADGTVTLDWPDVHTPDLATYTVERRQPDGTWATIATPTASTFTDSGLADGTAYAYRVSATDLSGNRGAPSRTATGTPVAGAVSAAERLVTVGDYSFGPDTLYVNRGDTVVWNWTGPDVNHTVTSAPGQADAFESHPGVADAAVTAPPPGGAFRHTFTTTGTFTYLCRIHPDMRAEVTVVDGGAPAGAQSSPRTGLNAAAAQKPVAPAARNHVAKVAQYRFTPANLTIAQGDSVTWLWTGADRDHSVTARPGQAESFDSHAGLKLGQITGAPHSGNFVHVFTHLGTFTYVCRLHPNMVGTVTVVKPSATSPLRLRASAASVRAGRVRLRLRLSDPARVRAQLRRGGQSVRTYAFAAPRGVSMRALALPRRGVTYQLVLRATRGRNDRAAPVTLRVRARAPSPAGR